MHHLLTKIQSTYILNLITLLFALTFLFYSNTLLNGLFFDDEQFIYENQAVQTFTISDFFTRSLVTGSGQLSNYYRPLLFTTFAVEYQLFGDAGFIYHLSSVVIHITGGILLFLFLDKLFRNRQLAFFTALFWLIHPVQTEAVAYASGLGDPLSFLFVLLTLHLSLFQTRKTTFFASVTLLMALLSKEIALITPGLLLLTHLVRQGKFTKLTLIKTLTISLPFIVITGAYFLLRLTVLNFANTLNFYGSENLYSGSLLVRLNTFFHLLPEYIKLLVFPKDLFMERDVVIDIQQKPTVLSVTSFLTLIGITLLGLWQFFTKRSVLLLFSIGWFVMAFIPTMGIIPINGIFYEHFLYYPSVGFFLLTTSLFLMVIKKISFAWQTLALLILCTVFLLLGGRTFARNSEWRDPITFYEQTLSYAPSARIYNNLAMVYAESGQQQKAVETYHKSLQLADVYPETHYNLANSYIELGNIGKAEEHYRKALELNPYFYLSHLALFQLYSQTEDETGKQNVLEMVKKLAEENPTFTTLLQQLERQN